MTLFEVRDGQFWLNGQPQFIHAAEFHYFRTPADQWRQRLGLLQEAGFNTVATYIPWLWHQPAPDISDVDGHTHPMRDLAGFLDLAAEMGFHLIARPGPYIMAETINEGIPPWVFTQYPRAAFIDQYGTVQNIASYLHPDFLKAVEGWYKAVFAVLTPRQVTQGGRIVLTQLDNEMGMIHWVRNIIDTNPDTLERFTAWLRETYGPALSDRYPAADLMTFAQAQLTTPEDAYGARVLEDYRRFFRDYLRRYMLHLWERAQAHGMTAPPVVNIHGFTNTSGGRAFPIGLSQLIEAMEIDGMVSATDVYPLHIDEGNFDQLLMVNEMTKALQNPAQPLFSIEFQSGGNQDFSGVQSSYYDLHSRLCFSVGMRAINHYLFFAGTNDPILSPVKRHDWGPPVRNDGSVRRHYARYGELSRALNAYGTDLVRAQPKTVTTIGFALDDFMTEVNNTATRSATDVLTHQREVILFDFLARGLALTHRPFDALELARAVLDPERTPLLWVMLDQQCDAAVQQKLLDYANGGGRLVIVGRMCAQTRDHAPCTLLQDGLGLRAVHRHPPFTEALITAFDDLDIPVTFLETYEGVFDEVFAASATGETVGFLRRVGAGQVMMLGAALSAHTLDDLRVFDRMAERMDCPPLFTLNEWADVRLSAGERGNFLFAANYLDDPIETTVTQAGVPLLGGHPLLLPARRGLILPLEWQLRPGVTVHYLTAEVRAVAEDETGLTLTTAPADFHAELTLDGYYADDSLIVARSAGRVTVRGTGGVLQLQKG
jgi:beta-galactosidase